MAKTQKERIYDLLEERGPKGVLNIELNEICFRYGGGSTSYARRAAASALLR